MLNEIASRQWKKEHKLSPGEVLKMLRSRSGLTQAQLAELLGFNSPRMVRNWEGEFYLPAYDRLQRLVEIYLNRGVFVRGEEREEAAFLWNTVKNWFETHNNKLETYPVFDERWFEAAYRAATTSEPLQLPVKTQSKTVTKLSPDSATPPKHNLVGRLSSFIGREEDEARLLQLLLGEKPGHRLVTLTGTGGVGKTRLALEVATNLAERNYYKDGVWLIELASISDPQLLAQTMALALGLKDKVGVIKEKASLENLLVEYLHAKQLLLLVDNCEHLILESAYLIEILLKSCPEIQILVTSREILNLMPETQYPLSGLSVPKANFAGVNQSSGVFEVIQKSEAAQLFIERASKRQLDFPYLVQTHEQTATSVVQICQQLDGLPLAIELAAARVPTLSPVQIVEHLSDRFHLLTGGERTALPRQQTLEAAMEWSYQLLSPSEQHIFQGLAVFSGGWTLEAAEQVCRHSFKGQMQVMDLVAQLANKSLVVIESGGNINESRHKEWAAMLEPNQYRYCYLDTIREYALKQLRANQTPAELEVLHEQHALYYLQLATQAEPFFRTAQQKIWVKRLTIELDNIRAALKWCEQGGQADIKRVELGLSLGTALWQYWNVTGFYQEGLEHLKMIQEQVQASGLNSNQKYLSLLNARAFLYKCVGDYTQAQELAQRALELAEIRADVSAQALALYILGLSETR